METFSALLAICAGSSPASGVFPAQRPVTRSFDVFFDLCLNKRLRKQSWGWWFETLSRPLWRHCNVLKFLYIHSWTMGSIFVINNWTKMWRIVIRSNIPSKADWHHWGMEYEHNGCDILLLLLMIADGMPNIVSIHQYVVQMFTSCWYLGGRTVLYARTGDSAW